jgi:hypothetical protein
MDHYEIAIPKTITFNTRHQQTIKFEEGADAVSGANQITYRKDNAGYKDNKFDIEVFRFLFEPKVSIEESGIKIPDGSRAINILVSEKGKFLRLDPDTRKPYLDRKNVYNFKSHPEFERLLKKLLKINTNGTLLEEFEKLKSYEFIIVLDNLDILTLENATLGNIESESRDRSRSRGRSTGRSRSRSRDKRDSTRGNSRRSSRDRHGSTSIGGKTKKNKRRTITKKIR